MYSLSVTVLVTPLPFPAREQPGLRSGQTGENRSETESGQACEGDNRRAREAARRFQDDFGEACIRPISPGIERGGLSPLNTVKAVQVSSTFVQVNLCAHILKFRRLDRIKLVLQPRFVIVFQHLPEVVLALCINDSTEETVVFMTSLTSW